MVWSSTHNPHVIQESMVQAGHSQSFISSPDLVSEFWDYIPKFLLNTFTGFLTGISNLTLFFFFFWTPNRFLNFPFPITDFCVSSVWSQTSLTLFLSHLQSTNIPVGSSFKVHPESEDFSSISPLPITSHYSISLSPFLPRTWCMGRQHQLAWVLVRNARSQSHIRQNKSELHLIWSLGSQSICSLKLEMF